MMLKRNKHTLLYLLLAGIFIAGCQTSMQDIAGTYRGIMDSPGGELAFPIHLKMQDGELKGFVTNSSDTLPFSTVKRTGDSLFLEFDFYDSNIRAKIKDNNRLEGTWLRRTSGGEYVDMPFRARKNLNYRYQATNPDSMPFDGQWRAVFTDDKDTSKAVGIFVSEPSGQLHGTFARETGDYRYLEGVYTDSTFTLSTFDGAHAYLFKGRLTESGRIKGDFWSKDTYHATWRAQRSQEDVLRNPMQLMAEEAVGRKVQFAFPNTKGDTITHNSPRFENKPMLVYLFGSWCPNCADEARLIRNLYDKYHKRDLRVVGLAFEYTGKFAKDSEMVRRYRNRFNIPWTLLIAGVSDKDRAAESLPFLDQVISYPTAIFTDRNHKIQYIHVGFNGPATGSYYIKEKQRFKNKLDAITKP